MRTLGVVKEQMANETRVALVPEVVMSLTANNAYDVIVEKGAGLLAGFTDEEFIAAGASIAGRNDVIARSTCLLSINGAEFFKEPALKDKMLISLFDPYFNVCEIQRLKEQSASVLSLELIPRISRAQSMDVLSSQANIAGYAAVLLAASKLPKVIPLMMTAAGTIRPAKMLVIGAGVAGLQAVATAKRLGAVVYAFDVRSVVKQQVESLGAKFVEINLNESAEGGGGYAKAMSHAGQRELREKLVHFAKDMDVIITTAQIPGRKAPLLLDVSIFDLVKSETVIIDLAAATGGNVAGSIVGEWVKKGRVFVYGAGNLSSMMPKDASFTFSKNLKALVDLITETNCATDDEILQDALICHQGAFINQAFLKFMEQK